MVERSQYWAFLVYPESAPDDWFERLRMLHIPALVSPLHNGDAESEGKPHFHVEVCFESLKSGEQVYSLFRDIAANGHLIRVQSFDGYTRYLVHRDDPDKEQFNENEIKLLSGASTKDAFSTEGIKAFREITEYIVDNRIDSLNILVDAALLHHPSWLDVLRVKPFFVIKLLDSMKVRNESFAFRSAVHRREAEEHLAQLSAEMEGVCDV